MVRVLVTVCLRQWTLSLFSVLGSIQVRESPSAVCAGSSSHLVIVTYRKR